MNKLLLSLAAVAAFTFTAAAETTDVINQAATGVKGTNYTSGNITTTNSGAEYAFQCAGDKGSVQLRSKNSNSGVVTTKTGGKITSIKVDWHSETADDRVLNIYASHEAYTNPTDLYKSGVKYIAQLKHSEATNGISEYTFTEDFEYVGFRSNSGAMYLNSIELTWNNGSTGPTISMPAITCADNKVTITAAEGADIYYTTDGTEPTTASTKYTAPFAITANVTVKAIAVKGGETSAVASFDAKYEATYNGFESFIAAGKGTTGVVDGPLTVIYQNGQNLYMQDSKGYQTLVFGAAGKSGLTNGDNFKDLSATVGEYGKAVQLTNPTLGEALAKGAAIAPSEHGLDELAASMLHRYVKLSGVSITGAPGTKKANFSITDGETTVVGRNNFQIDVQDGENFTITGFVCVYNGALQIYPVTIEGGQVMETVETPVIAPEAGSVKAGTEVTITCATEGAVIFYTLDGTKPTAASTEYKAPFALTADATVSAIAVKEGMVDSKVATAAYTILAADENVYTFDFNLDGNAATLTDAKVEAGNGQKDYDPNNLEGVQFINGPVTMWIDAPSGSLPRWWGATDKAGVTYSELRFYKGNVLNVSVNTNGQKIQSISFPKGYGSNFPTADQLTFSVDNGTIDIASRSWTAPADKVVTEVTVTVAATTNCGAVQVVTVKDDSAVSGVENIEAADENAPVEYFNLQGVRVSQPAAGLYIVRQGNKVSKVLVK